MRRSALLLWIAVVSSCAPRLAQRTDEAMPPRAPAPAPEPLFTLAVGGDVTLGYHFEEWFDEQVSKGVPKEEMLGYGFREVRPVAAGADLFVVNLECPFTERGEKLPKNFNFRARPELVGELLRGGVGAVSLANNHMMDWGAQGLADTIATLDAAGIPHFGAGRNLAEARRPAIVERGGLRVAFLGYFFLGDENIEPRAVIATDTTPGVAGDFSSTEVMEKLVREDVVAALGQADLVIPFFHWGKERTFVPRPYQSQLARAAIDAGAAMVLGSHPHVLQGMELYRGRPIVYSLGNFVFGGNWDPKPKETALLRVRFSRAGYVSTDVVPLKTDRFPERPAQPYPVEGEEARQVLELLGLYSSGFQTPLPELPAPPAEEGAAPGPR